VPLRPKCEAFKVSGGTGLEQEDVRGELCARFGDEYCPSHTRPPNMQPEWGVHEIEVQKGSAGKWEVRVARKQPARGPGPANRPAPDAAWQDATPEVRRGLRRVELRRLLDHLRKDPRTFQMIKDKLDSRVPAGQSPVLSLPGIKFTVREYTNLDDGRRHNGLFDPEGGPSEPSFLDSEMLFD